MTAAAAERFGDRLGRRRRRHRAHLRRAARARPARSAPRSSRRASSRATGSPSGRPTAPSGSSPCSACSRPARCSSRSTPGSRAPRRPTSSRRSGARVLVTVTDFLGTDYVAMLDGTGVELPDLDTIVVVARARAGRAPCRGTTFVGRGRRRRPRRGRPARRRGRPRRPVRHPLHLGHHRRARRASCRPTAARCGWPPTGWR